MTPRRRLDGSAPPNYGARSSLFSLEINHGGNFIGSGSEKKYIDGSVIWFDHVDTVTWSPLMLESIVEEIGYEMQGRVKVEYCIPILSVSRNGLRPLVSEEDTQQICNFVSIGHHFISLYLLHDEPTSANGTSNVMRSPLTDLPPVVSPPKVIAVENENADHVAVPVRREGLRARKNIETDEEEGLGSDEAEDSDFELSDSDYEISDGDDDLYADNVDSDEENVKKVKKGTDMKMKEAAKIDHDSSSEEEDISAPDSDDDKGMDFKFKTFGRKDMQFPKFEVGQIFESVDMLRKAIREYVCQTRWDIKLPINDKRRLCARCVVGCSWYLWASVDSRTKCWMIKKYVPYHICGKKWKVKAFTANFLADKYLENFRADQDMNLKNFSRVIQKEWHMTPGRSKLQRARRLAMKVIYGDEEAQYKLLWDYANEIRRSNPGSSFYLSLDDNARFKRCYMSLEACKKGFLQGCRPVIFIDGCFIKTRYRGQLLAAIGIDPNDCIFPVAFACVEVEDTVNWSWFLETLKKDLDINNTTPWTIMSDKQKGLINAVKEQFPDSEHRFCVRHMWQNFQQVFRGDALKNQVWMIARSSTVVRYEMNMEYMKALNPDAHAWLNNLDPKTWVRAFQSDTPKCDILLNNNCEVFNKYILDARELPILSMFDRIKDQLMTRHYTKLKEASGWKGVLCPKIQKKLDKLIELANNSFVEGAGDGLFKVGEISSGTPTDYIVDLKSWTCTCNRWQKTGIPCRHALSCMRHDNLDPVAFVHNCYSVDMFKKAYGNIIYPCKDKTEWERMNWPPILPPNYQRHVGRPTKARRKAPGEVDARGGGKKMSRHGVIMHCGYCGEPDHNITGCKYVKAGLPPPNAAAPQTTPPPDPIRTQEQPQQSRQYDDLAVENMSQQVPRPRVIETGPVPESSFITAAQSVLRQPQTSQNTVRQGALAQQLLALQQQKNKILEDKKLAVLEAKYRAELKKAEEAAKKKEENDKRKAEQAAAKAIEVAARKEQRKLDAAIAKQAREETRKFAAQVQRGINQRNTEKKKLAAQEKKLAEKKKNAEERAAKRSKLNAAAQTSVHQPSGEASVDHDGAPEGAEVLQSRTKKVNMFDEFRSK